MYFYNYFDPNNDRLNFHKALIIFLLRNNDSTILTSELGAAVEKPETTFEKF